VSFGNVGAPRGRESRDAAVWGRIDDRGKPEPFEHAWAPLLLLFLVGLVLTITRAVTKSVAASWIIHVAYNATLFGFLYVGSQGFRHLENVK